MKNLVDNVTAGTLAEMINNCKNNISVDELIKLESLETHDITEQLRQAKAEVERLESVISDKAATEAKKKKEEAEKFLNSLC